MAATDESPGWNAGTPMTQGSALPSSLAHPSSGGGGVNPMQVANTVQGVMKGGQFASLLGGGEAAGAGAAGAAAGGGAGLESLALLAL